MVTVNSWLSNQNMYVGYFVPKEIESIRNWGYLPSIYITIYNFDWFLKKKETQLEHLISKVVRDMKYVKNIAESISNFQGDVFDFICMASFMSLELWA